MAERFIEHDGLYLRQVRMIKQIYVYRVLDAQKVLELDDSGSRIRRYDFTALVEDSDGELLEFAYDSRYFERVA